MNTTTALKTLAATIGLSIAGFGLAAETATASDAPNVTTASVADGTQSASTAELRIDVRQGRRAPATDDMQRQGRRGPLTGDMQRQGKRAPATDDMQRHGRRGPLTGDMLRHGKRLPATGCVDQSPRRGRRMPMASADCTAAASLTLHRS